MYYFQIQELRRSSYIYQFGRHYLTRLQFHMIVLAYMQQVQELEEYNAKSCPEFIGMELDHCWDTIRIQFENGYNINHSKWRQSELQLLRDKINHEIYLHSLKPVFTELKTQQFRVQLPLSPETYRGSRF